MEATEPTSRPSELVLYLIGPMTGKPDYNRPAFNAAADQLRAAGFHVTNPAQAAPPCPDPEWSDWIRAGIMSTLCCHGLALLPGTGHSRGAKLELSVGFELGLPIHSVAGWIAYAQTKAAQL